MSQLYLTSIGRQNADWLAVRQVLVSENVANANTPGFQVRDVKPFTPKGIGFTNLVATNASHFAAPPASVGGVSITKGSNWETHFSGNSVSIPQESLKLGEIGAGFELNTSIIKSFHRLMLTAFAG